MLVFLALTDLRYKNDVENKLSYNDNRIYLLIWNKMEHINDKFLMNESHKGTRVLVDKGLSINMVCKLVERRRPTISTRISIL